MVFSTDLRCITECDLEQGLLPLEQYSDVIEREGVGFINGKFTGILFIESIFVNETEVEPVELDPWEFGDGLWDLLKKEIVSTAHPSVYFDILYWYYWLDGHSFWGTDNDGCLDGHSLELGVLGTDNDGWQNCDDLNFWARLDGGTLVFGDVKITLQWLSCRAVIFNY